MKLEVNRLAMLEAARNVAKVAPSLSKSDILKKVLLETSDDTGEVYMTATNNQISIQHKVIASVEESGSLLIDPALLVGMMAKLEGEIVSLSISPDKPEVLRVTAGRCVFQINYHTAKGYPRPTMPFPEDSVIMTGICSLAKRTTFVVSQDESKPALQCVQVKLKSNAIHAAACDNARMMLVKDSAEHTDEREFLLPGRSLQTLASISSDDDVFEVGDIGNEIVFVRGDMIFTIRKFITGSFIDVPALVKRLKPAYAAVVDVGNMKEGLNLVSVVALSGDKKKPVNLVLSGDGIILRCVVKISESNSVVSANVTKETPDTGFYYDVSALIKLFQVVGGRVKLEIDANGFMSVKTRNEAYFQAPVRPPVADEDEGEESEKQNKEQKQKRTKGAKDMKETAEPQEAA